MEDHVAIVMPDGIVQFKHVDTMPVPPVIDPDYSVYIEVKSAFIRRQPDQWVIVKMEPDGIRIGCGTITPHNMQKVEGVN